MKIAEAPAAAAVVFFTVWLMVKAVVWAIRQVITHWRTSLTVLALGAWWQWWGWPSLALTTGVITEVLTGWRLVDLASFDAWAGRRLRAWWARWTIYAPKLPAWLHACGLTITHATPPASGLRISSPRPKCNIYDRSTPGRDKLGQARPSTAAGRAQSGGARSPSGRVTSPADARRRGGSLTHRASTAAPSRASW